MRLTATNRPSRSARRRRAVHLSTGLLLLAAAGIAAGAPDEPPRYEVDREEVVALPYLGWRDIEPGNEGLVGVTTYDRERAASGINFFKGQKGHAYLLSMSGNILHRLKAPFQQVVPDEADGFLFVGGSVGRMDWKSNILWKRKDLEGHHDVDFADNGDVYALTHHAAVFPELGSEAPIDDNHVVILTRDGEIKKRISIARLLLKERREQLLARYRRHLPRYLWLSARGELPKKAKRGLDVLHANTLEIVKQDAVRDGRKLFEKGDVLISIRTTDDVAVIDVEAEKLVWLWGNGELEGQHQPSQLEGGNILIFDNGTRRQYSRVVELDPATEEIVWEYKADPPESFYTFSSGGAERLPNGNTLIAESNKGRIFEVTPDGEIVWEFWSGEVEDGKRATIYRFSRITDPEKYPRLWPRR